MQHELDIKYLDADGLVKTAVTQTSDQAFCRIYREGLWYGKKIISMEWTHKGETHKLIFGD